TLRFARQGPSHFAECLGQRASRNHHTTITQPSCIAPRGGVECGDTVEHRPRARPTGFLACTTRLEAACSVLRQRAMLPAHAPGTKPLAEPEAVYCNGRWRGGVDCDTSSRLCRTSSDLHPHA